MKARPLEVVVTGAECTGKTTLARELGMFYGAPVSAEFARRYVDEVQRPLHAGDVEPIANGQIREEETALARAGALVVLDTDLVSTVVYATHYYARCPTWIVALARERLADLYLLLHPDVPWIAEGLQRDRRDHRQIVHDTFARQLRSWGARCLDVTGTWDERRQTAVGAIDELLAIR
jgi:NadR type nicotinamide-nucleotide adenylyltransferase